MTEITPSKFYLPTGKTFYFENHCCYIPGCQAIWLNLTNEYSILVLLIMEPDNTKTEAFIFPFFQINDLNPASLCCSLDRAQKVDTLALQTTRLTKPWRHLVVMFHTLLNRTNRGCLRTRVEDQLPRLGTDVEIQLGDVVSPGNLC